MHEPEPRKTAALTAEDIGKILTRERLRMLRNIREKALESRSEPAGMLEHKGAHGKNHGEHRGHGEKNNSPCFGMENN